jgi:hypothetical protein
VSSSWGFTLAPYAMIAAFLLLMCFWLLKTRISQGRWTWDIKSLNRVDLTEGMAPVVGPPVAQKNIWLKIGHRILNTL